MLLIFIAALLAFKYKQKKTFDGLCNSCVNVHSIKDYRGRELIYCNYGSELRAIKFAVCECTGYKDKNVAPVARIAGFVRSDEINTAEAFPAIVVRIAPG
jgi:hypothetical protein